MDVIFSKYAVKTIVKFVPEDEPLPDEIEAIEIGRREIMRGEAVSHADIDWD